MPRAHGTRTPVHGGSVYEDSPAHRLLHLHLGVVDHFAPLRLFGLDAGGEIGRHAGDRIEVLLLEEALLDLGIGEYLAHLGIDLGRDVCRHRRRAEQAEPGDRLVAGQAALGDGRDLGEERHALLGADGDELDLARFPLRHRAADADEHQLDVTSHHVGQGRCRALVAVSYTHLDVYKRQLGEERHALLGADGDELDLARFPLRHRAADADEHQLDVTSHHVGQGRCRALVVHGLQLHARQRLEQLHVEMAARADAEGAVVELAGLLLGERKELLHVAHRRRRIEDQRVIDADETRDRREPVHGVVGQLGIEARIDHEGRLRPDEQRVSVGCRLGDVFRRDLIVGARPVLDDDLLAPGFGEALREQAGKRIGDAAGRGRHHDGDWLGRIIGCAALRKRRRRPQAASQDKPRPHGLSPSAIFIASRVPRWERARSIAYFAAAGMLRAAAIVHDGTSLP